MKRVAMIAFVLLCLAGLAFLFVNASDERASRRGAALGDEADGGPGAADGGPGADSAAKDPERGAARQGIDDDPNRVPGPDVLIRGRVLKNGAGLDDAAVVVSRALPAQPTTVPDWTNPLRNQRMSPPIAETRTREDGRFSVIISRRTRFTLRASSPGCGAERVFVLVPPNGDPPEVILRLTDGHALAGLVVDPERKPVAGALVRLGTNSWRLPPYIVAVKTDEAGRFRFQELKESEYWLRVSADGYPVLQRWPGVPRAQEVLVKLEAGGSIAGRVTGDSGSPLVKARVFLTTGEGYRGATGPVEVETGEAGEYRVAHALPGPVTSASILHPSFGLRSSRQGSLILPTGLVRAGAELRYDIELRRGARVSGVVVEAGSGQPVQGAHLTLLGMLNQSRSLRDVAYRTSDKEGRFVFGNVPEGTYAIEARTRFAIRKVTRWAQVQTALTIDFYIDAEESAPVPEQRIVVEPSGAVRGRVLGYDGTRFRRIGVNLQTGKGQENGAVDHTGAFEFRNVPPTPEAVIQSWNPQAKSEPFAVEAGQVAEVDLDPALTGGFVGKVEDEHGRPLAGALVKAATQQMGRQEISNLLSGGNWNAATTDDQGRFIVQVQDWHRQNYKSSRWMVVAVHREYPLAVVRGLKLPAEGKTTEVRVVMSPGGSVAGSVAGADGIPLPNVHVSVSPRKPKGVRFETRQTRYTYTDLEGRFEITGLGEGAYWLSAAPVDGKVERREVERGATGLRLVVEPTGSIKGVVVDEEGRPVASGRIYALIPTAKGERKHNGSLEGGSGRFRIANLPSGSYAIEVTPQTQQAWGQQVPQFKKTRIPPVPTGRDDVVIEVASGEALMGRVLGPGRKPIGGASVIAMPVKLAPNQRQNFYSAVRPTATTNGKGVFELKGLGEGEVELIAVAGGYLPVSRKASPLAGEVVLRLEKGRGLEGRLLKPDGGPLRNQWFSLHPASPQLQQKLQDWQMRGGQSFNMIGGWQLLSSQTDGEGKFRFPSLFPGSYRLVLQVADGVAPDTPLQPGGAPVTIRLDPALSIKGRVTDVAGQPVVLDSQIENQQIHVGALKGSRWLQWAPVDADGHFEIKGLPAGALTLQVWAGNRYKPAKLEVQAGDHAVQIVLEPNVKKR